MKEIELKVRTILSKTQLQITNEAPTTTQKIWRVWLMVCLLYLDKPIGSGLEPADDALDFGLEGLAHLVKEALQGPVVRGFRSGHP